MFFLLPKTACEGPEEGAFSLDRKYLKSSSSTFIWIPEEPEVFAALYAALAFSEAEEVPGQVLRQEAVLRVVLVELEPLAEELALAEVAEAARGANWFWKDMFIYLKLFL